MTGGNKRVRNMIEIENYVAIVPVRGGSKGLPGKNVRFFAGLPLYRHAVEQGLHNAERCLISSDIEAILNADLPERCEVLRRPANLAGDSVPMDEVLADIVQRCDLGGATIILLQATSPLRLNADIQKAKEVYRTGNYDLVMSVTGTESGILKYGVMEGERFRPVARPDYCFMNRQQLPPVYRPNGAVYIFGADWFAQNGQLATDRIGAIEIPEARSLDIDTLIDFERAEKMYKSFRLRST